MNSSQDEAEAGRHCVEKKPASAQNDPDINAHDERMETHLELSKPLKM